MESPKLMAMGHVVVQEGSQQGTFPGILVTNFDMEDGETIWNGSASLQWLQETDINTWDRNVESNLGKGDNFTLGDLCKPKDREKQT